MAKKAKFKFGDKVRTVGKLVRYGVVVDVDEADIDDLDFEEYFVAFSSTVGHWMCEGDLKQGWKRK